MKWINPNLCSMYDDQVRVELGPQIIELPATEQTIKGGQIMPYYKEGALDALGKVIKICPEGGSETIHVVDHRQKFVKKLWKVYDRQKTNELSANHDYIFRYIKVAEYESKDQAIKHAKSLRSFWQRTFGDK